ncbi:Protease synthase and sporulation negative regulatory protein PAI 1 [Sphingomonas antarctica]|uniref:GNAT family N-acetyltransferase n=1 Tax=Sphingomonas antarctica TaxID=2040274 RepID=UPI0039EC99F6
MNWTIRQAREDDCDQLALIGAATFLETFAGVLGGTAIVAHCRLEHTEDAYAKLIGSGARAWLALLQPGDAPVGFALTAPADLPGMVDGDVELKRIYALSRVHGSGVGGALMEHAIDAARDAGANRLLLGVYAENHRAIAFYGKNGFAPVATRKFNVGGIDYDDVVLARSL